MKNIPELSCAIVEDLLPTYVERLTSEETNMAVEAHLASCPACAAKRTAMGAKETEAAGQNAEETAREVDYLKKVRRRNRRRVWLAVACTTLVLAAVILQKSSSLVGRDKPMMWGFASWKLWMGTPCLSMWTACMLSMPSTAGNRMRQKMGLFLSPPVKREPLSFTQTI